MTGWTVEKFFLRELDTAKVLRNLQSGQHSDADGSH